MSRVRYWLGVIVEACFILFVVWALIVVASGVPR